MRKLFLLIAICAHPSVYALPLYHVTELYNCFPGQGASINDQGQVAGYAEMGTGVHQAFLYDRGAITYMPTEGSGGAYAINHSGQVVRNSQAASGVSGFLWTPDTPNGTTGTMVPTFRTPFWGFRGFTNLENPHQHWVPFFGRFPLTANFNRFEPEKAVFGPPKWPRIQYSWGAEDGMVDLESFVGPNSNSSDTAINNQGQIAGGSQYLASISESLRPFLWTSDAPNGTTGTMADINPLGGQSYAEGINDLGQVVGAMGPYDARAFLYSDNRSSAGHGDNNLMAEPYDSQTFFTDFNDAEAEEPLDGTSGLGILDAVVVNGSKVTWGAASGLLGTGGVRIEPSGRLGYASPDNLNKPEATVMFWMKPNWWIPDPTAKSMNPSGKGLHYAIPFAEICSGVDEPYCRWMVAGVGAAQSGHPQLQRFLNDDSSPTDTLLAGHCSWNFQSWVHVTLTWTASTGRFAVFYNGIPIQVDNEAMWTETADSTWFCFGSTDDYSETCGFDGWFDNIRCFNRGLTDDEIEEVYLLENPYGRINLAKPYPTVDELSTFYVNVRPNTTPAPADMTVDWSLDTHPGGVNIDSGEDVAISQLGDMSYRGSFQTTPDTEGWHLMSVTLKAPSVGAGELTEKVAVQVLDDPADDRTTFTAPVEDGDLSLTEVDIGGTGTNGSFNLYDDIDAGVAGGQMAHRDDYDKIDPDPPLTPYVELGNVEGTEDGDEGWSSAVHAASTLLVKLDNLLVDTWYLLRFTYPDDDQRSFRAGIFFPWWPSEDWITGITTGGFRANTNTMLTHDFVFRTADDSTDGVAVWFRNMKDGRSPAIATIRCYKIGLDRLPKLASSDNNRRFGPQKEDSLYNKHLSFRRGRSQNWTPGQWDNFLTRWLDMIQFYGCNSWCTPMGWYSGNNGMFPGLFSSQGQGFTGTTRAFNIGAVTAARCAQRGIEWIPRTTHYLHAKDTRNLNRDKNSITAGDATDSSIQIKDTVDEYYVPTSDTAVGGFQGPSRNVGVFENYKNTVIDFTLQYAVYDNVPGIIIDARSNSPLGFGPITFGYEDSTCEEFVADTGADMPLSSAGDATRFYDRYQWAINDADNLEQWTAWRCAKVYANVKEILTEVQSIRADFKLYIMLYPPYAGNWSAGPETDSGWAANLVGTADDLEAVCRQAGWDVSLYEDDDGIVFQRVHSNSQAYLQEFYSPADVLAETGSTDWWMWWVHYQEYHAAQAYRANTDRTNWLSVTSEEHTIYEYEYEMDGDERATLRDAFVNTPLTWKRDLFGTEWADDDDAQDDYESDIRMGGTLNFPGGQVWDIAAVQMLYNDPLRIMAGCTSTIDPHFLGRHLYSQKFAQEFRSIQAADYTLYERENSFPIYLKYLYSGGSTYLYAVNMIGADVSYTVEVGQTTISYDFDPFELKAWTVAEDTAQIRRAKITSSDADWKIWLLKWYLLRRAQSDRLTREVEPDAETAAFCATRVGAMTALAAIKDWKSLLFEYLYGPSVQVIHSYIDGLAADTNNDPVFDDTTATLAVVSGGKVSRSFSATHTTETTVSPDANPEDSSVDGFVYLNSVTDWATLHDAATGSAADSGLTLIVKIQSSSGGNWYNISRVVLLFDTSGIPADATINSASLFMNASAKSDSFSPAINPTINVFTSDPAGTTALDAGDYIHTKFGTTPLSTDIAYADFNTGPGGNTWVFNADGRAAINPGGITKLALRESTYDAPDSEPVHSASKVAQFQLRSAEHTPAVLTINYTTASDMTFEGYLLPDGATLNASTGLLEWDVRAAHEGTNKFLVHVTDGISGHDTLAVTATVSAPEGTLSITKDLLAWWPPELRDTSRPGWRTMATGKIISTSTAPPGMKIGPCSITREGKWMQLKK